MNGELHSSAAKKKGMIHMYDITRNKPLLVLFYHIKVLPCDTQAGELLTKGQSYPVSGGGLLVGGSMSGPRFVALCFNITSTTKTRGPQAILFT